MSPNIKNDKYVYSVTLNGIQTALLVGLVERGIYGRNAADVIRRILDEKLIQFCDMPKVDLRTLLR